jgi:hypothetical protein
LGVLDGVDELGEFIAHGFTDDTCCGSLEIEVGGTASAGVEGVGAGKKGSHLWLLKLALVIFLVVGVEGEIGGG